VVAVEPGDCPTRVGEYRVKTEQSRESSAYRQRMQTALEIMERDERNGSDPARIAHRILRIVQSSSPRLRYTVGSLFERAAALVKKLLPSRFAERLVSMYYRVAHE
jgi:hypothetical protein